MTAYRIAPLETEHFPPGIAHIVGNEGAERFSFYGMKAILFVFMTTQLANTSGAVDVMTKEQATAWIHLFVFGVYITPLFGALLSDLFLGKYRTIMLLSLVYCAGHLALALDDTRLGLMLGLGLIALGAGGIKPCVSAHVGDQFGSRNASLLPRVFGWFYFAINAGAFGSMIATPWLLDQFGPSWAFGVPGVLMGLATLVFWAGRYRFAHVPPAGRQFVREAFGPDGLKAMGKLAILYVFVAVFWALFDQTASRWVDQALHMNCHFMGFEILPAQMQSLNPLLVMLLIPVFTYGIYPWVERVARVTPLRKIAAGFFVATLAFALPVWLESRISNGHQPSIAWQALAYLLMTAAEVMISITCLEFSYTQAPRAMKSFIMALFMASIAFGNLFTAGVNLFIQNADGTSRLEGAWYYGFFTGCMAVTAVVFIPMTWWYREKSYLHTPETDQAVAEDTMAMRE